MRLTVLFLLAPLALACDKKPKETSKPPTIEVTSDRPTVSPDQLSDAASAKAIGDDMNGMLENLPEGAVVFQTGEAGELNGLRVGMWQVVEDEKGPVVRLSFWTEATKDNPRREEVHKGDVIDVGDRKYRIERLAGDGRDGTVVLVPES